MSSTALLAEGVLSAQLATLKSVALAIGGTMSIPITNQLLYAYFEGCVTDIEKQSIAEWAKLAPNRELFLGCLASWEGKNLQVRVDVDRALERHQQRVASQSDGSSSAGTF